MLRLFRGMLRMKSYKLMTYKELKDRVKELNSILRSKPNNITYKQSKKELENIERMIREYDRNRN